MRIIICFFLVLALAVCSGIWKAFSDTKEVYGRIRGLEKELSAISEETKALDRYTSEAAGRLEELYAETFCDIKEICAYYHADCEIKISGEKDLVNIRDFFKASKYKGIHYIDILARVDLKNQPDVYAVSVIYNALKTRPVEIQKLNLEKDVLSLSLRLYGN
ncbi:MAG: hypothetical protein PHT53_08025 [Candidatus Omnitrophica bacterium]|nr:hypothetical protein [Candidatus Omnitrophota bacterium]